MAKKHLPLFLPPDATPPPRSVTHQIRLLPDVVPAKRAPYPLGEEKLAVMQEQNSDLAAKGWIVLSHSAWSAFILFVKKKEGSWRLCTDFRDLNALSIDDSFPLPYALSYCCTRAGAASTFSKIDLASGFHQIALEREDPGVDGFQPSCSGRCRHTHWEWTVMPFGLKNVPPTFSAGYVRRAVRMRGLFCCLH